MKIKIIIGQKSKAKDVGQSCSTMDILCHLLLHASCALATLSCMLLLSTIFADGFDVGPDVNHDQCKPCLSGLKHACSRSFTDPPARCSVRKLPH